MRDDSCRVCTSFVRTVFSFVVISHEANFILVRSSPFGRQATGTHPTHFFITKALSYPVYLFVLVSRKL